MLRDTSKRHEFIWFSLERLRSIEVETRLESSFSSQLFDWYRDRPLGIVVQLSWDIRSSFAGKLAMVPFQASRQYRSILGSNPSRTKQSNEFFCVEVWKGKRKLTILIRIVTMSTGRLNLPIWRLNTIESAVSHVFARLVENLIGLSNSRRSSRTCSLAASFTSWVIFGTTDESFFARKMITLIKRFARLDLTVDEYKRCI